MFNKYQFNPAFAGMDYSLSVTAVNRNQWSGFEGRPVSQSLNAHMPFYLWNGAFGINIENDKIGAQSMTSGSLSYNYVHDTEFGLFSAGLRLGVLQMEINGSELRTPDGVYEGNTIEHNDPILQSANFSGMAPVWDVGFYFVTDILEGGVSLMRFPGNSISLSEADIDLKSQVNLYLEYTYAVNDFVFLFPSVLVRTDFAQTQVDVSTLVRYENKYFGGLSIRGYNKNSFDALAFIVGMRISRNYMLSYSYDFGISGLRDFQDGTHEFVFNYNLAKIIGTGIPPKIIYNPRFL